MKRFTFFARSYSFLFLFPFPYSNDDPIAIDRYKENIHIYMKSSLLFQLNTELIVYYRSKRHIANFHLSSFFLFNVCNVCCLSSSPRVCSGKTIATFSIKKRAVLLRVESRAVVFVFQLLSAHVKADDSVLERQRYTLLYKHYIHTHTHTTWVFERWDCVRLVINAATVALFHLSFAYMDVHIFI